MPLYAPLAHAGAGASWQALVSLFGVGIAVLFVLAVAGRLQLRSGSDLVLPLAGLAIAASLAPALSAVLSDLVWWAVPMGAVLLGALLLATFRQIELSWRSPLAIGAVAVAVLAVVAFDTPITRAWHPPPDLLPRAADASVEIAQPEDGSTVDAGPVTIRVEVDGGSVGSGVMPDADAAAAGATAAALRINLDGRPVTTTAEHDCTVAQPCTSVTYTTEVTQGEHELLVELVRRDGVPFAPAIFDRVTFVAQ